MGRNFRLHEGSDMHGWDRSVSFTSKIINSIKDPNGADANREITSIPSPFARIDLVNTAFKQVSEIGLEGDSIFHKMVSDALDVGEIFFNYERFENDVEIIVWDKINDLENLIKSNNKSHKTLGETYRLYLEQDAKQNNFDELNRIYLLNYKKHGLKIIGATSPVTLFFTSANNLEIGDAFTIGKDVLFDEEYCPLFKRDIEYIKYLFSLRLSIPNFATKFRNLDEYLDKAYKLLSQSQRDIINSLDGDSINNFDSLSINGGNEVEVLGYTLRKAPSPIDKIRQSDFKIFTNRNISGEIPLALPNDIFTKELTYVTDTWSKDFKAPILDEDPLEKRMLPHNGLKYPYLTVSDLLEDYIIEAEFPINKEYFFTGYLNEGKYLLPIKPLFFDYFDADFLLKKIKGQNVFELKEYDKNMVEAILRLPIQKNEFIEFRRRYYRGVQTDFTNNLEIEKNKGVIIENRINLAVTPFYKFPNKDLAEYNVSLYEAERNPMFDDAKFELAFYRNGGEKINTTTPYQRISKKEDIMNLYNYTVESNIGRIDVNNSYTGAVLIPLMEEINGTEQFTFAIDFGTTNSHIEYSTLSNPTPKPFEIDTDNVYMIGTLVENPHEIYANKFIHDLFPRKIKKTVSLNEQSKYYFPQKTSLVYNNSLNFNHDTGAFRTFSIPFKYGIESFTTYETVSTNLKWDLTEGNDTKVKGFFEQILKMIRNKVALNNGAIEKTRIVWSYPASMQPYLLNRMRTDWEELVTKHFGSIELKEVCESLTPFYYYLKLEGVDANLKPIVSMDIGGKTTDIAIYKGKKPTLFTSYQFAGDALFGDNYNRNININAYINKYHDTLKGIIDAADEKDEFINYNVYSRILKDIKSTGKSTDLIDTYFKLIDSYALNKLEVDFSKILRNDKQLSSIFFIFTIANIYHLSKIFKEKGIKSPGLLNFAGNGAKILNLLDNSSSKKSLSLLINRVFKDVLREENVNVTIKLPDYSKEVSAKGGTFIFESGLVEDFSINEIKYVYQAEGENEECTYAEGQKLIEKVLKEFYQFLDYLENLVKDENISGLFYIDKNTLKTALEFLRENAEQKLLQGYELRKESLSEDLSEAKINETLFFYPLVGSLGEIAYDITTN